MKEPTYTFEEVMALLDEMQFEQFMALVSVVTEEIKLYQTPQRLAILEKMMEQLLHIGQQEMDKLLHIIKRM